MAVGEKFDLYRVGAAAMYEKPEEAVSRAERQRFKSIYWVHFYFGALRGLDQDKLIAHAQRVGRIFRTLR